MAAIAPGLSAALQDRYRLDRELGQGGMATVYLAHDLRNNRPVALKVLRPELAAVLGADRFLKEIETTANLQHPHILPLFDSGQTESFLFYVMPYVEGESLRDRLTREKQLPIPDAVRIATEVSAALDYAHRHGVLHRDIKPENILLHDGTALVADFGIALAMRKAGGARLTETGLSLGTPQYMSPEQATAERELDARTDVYALGAVTYEMLTGEPPFSGPTTQSVMAKLMTEAPRPVSVLRKAVPLAVESAVLTALEKLPADRFASAAEFAETLQGKTPGPVRTAAAGHAIRRSPGRAAVAFGAVAVIAVGTGAMLAWRHFASLSHDLPVIRFTIQPPLGDSIFLRGGRSRSLDISADGRRVVFVGVHGSDSVNQLYVHEMGNGLTWPLPSTEGASAPFFKPDGKWIGYFDEGTRRLMKVPAQGGQPQVICDCGPSLGAAWGNDGWIIFDPGWGREWTGLLRVRETGGKPEEMPLSDTTLSSEVWLLAAPQLLPGGTAALVTAIGQATSRVSAISLGTGQRTDLVPDADLGRYVEPGYLVYAKGVELWAVRFDPRRLEKIGEPFRVVDSVQGSAYALSRTGTLVYSRPVAVTGRDGRRLVWVDRNDQIEPVAGVPGGYWNAPRLSPDNARIVYWGWPYDPSNTAGGRVFLYDRTRGAPRALTEESFTSGFAIFAPDGRSVIFDSNREAGNGFRLYRTSSDGGTPVRLIPPAGEARRPTIQQQAYSWSPDGTALALQQGGDPKTRYDIYLFSPDGGGARPLLATSADERAPMFSPDGRWLAYVSDESGRFEVYLRRYPEFDEPVQLTRDGGDAPAWSADGREIFFARGEGLFVLPFADGRPGEPRQLINRRQRGKRNALAGELPYGRNYDIARDGRFLMMQQESSLPNGTELQVVLNWVTELRGGLGRAVSGP